MKKKVINGLLVALLVSNSIFGTTNVANAMISISDEDTLTLNEDSTITFEEVTDLTASTNEVEETSNELVTTETIVEENTAVEELNEVVEEIHSTTNTVEVVEPLTVETEEEITTEVVEETEVSTNIEKSQLESEVGSIQAKTTIPVNDIAEFEAAVSKSNVTVELNKDIEINEKVIDIKGNNITIEGNNHIITVKSATDKAALNIKTKNAIIRNVNIKNESKKPGLTVYNAKAGTNDTGVILTNIEIIGSKTAVALDVYNSTVELTNITCSDSLYKDFQIRNGSTVTLHSLNSHSENVVHLQTIQNAGEVENTINNLDKFYYVPGVVSEDSSAKKVTDYTGKVIAHVSTFAEFVENVQKVGTIIYLTDDIKVDENDAAYVKQINVAKNVTIEGKKNSQENYTLDLNNVSCLILKGNDIAVKNLNVINSSDYGINIYNSKNVLLENIHVSKSNSHGIFVNGSTVELNNYTTISNGLEGMKITRARSLKSASHIDSVVTVKQGSSIVQEESDVDVVIVNLDVNGVLSDNKFVFEDANEFNNTYTEHDNGEVTTKDGQEQVIDFTTKQIKLDVTTQDVAKDANGNPIRLVNDGSVDNTDNLIALIEYAAANSMELYFPAGTYKINRDIDLSTLNLQAPAASNFKLTGDANGLSIIDGSSNTAEMLKLLNTQSTSKMAYVGIEHLVFNNVSLQFKGEYKKAIEITNNVFMNGVSSDAYIELSVNGNKNYIKNNVENNIFLRGTDYLGKGITVNNSKNMDIKNNFFGNLEGKTDATKMIPNLEDKLTLVEASGLTTGEQGNFVSAISSQNDQDLLIQNNYIHLVKDLENSEHIIHIQEFTNAQIVANYFKGQENGVTGGVKISNGMNAYIGSNHFSNVPLLVSTDSNLTNPSLHNTVIYNNFFHQVTNFGEEGTGIVIDQSTTTDSITDLVIYQNEFKSDERDGINISANVQNAVNNNEILAFDNKYKNNNAAVNYIGAIALDESTLADIQGDLANNEGFTNYQNELIPLVPVNVDYTYLEEIYEEAKQFLEDIINNKLVGDTAGMYPTDVVQQLQDMLTTIEQLYKDGKLLQAETNTFVTELAGAYELVKNSKLPDSTEDDSNNGTENDSTTDDNNGTGNNNGNGNGSSSNGGNQNNGSTGSTDGEVNNPTVEEQEKLPQTGDTFLRVLMMLGMFFLAVAGVLFMKRPRTNE